MSQNKPLNFAQALRSKPKERIEPEEAPEAVSIVNGFAMMDSPAPPARLSRMDSLSTEQPPPLPATSPPKEDSLPTLNSPSNADNQNILAMIPHVAGHTQLPHAYTDHLARWLSADEQAVYVQLYRLSWGWGKGSCFISNPKLSERSGVPETSMRRAIRKLATKGLVEKTNRVFGSHMDQGIEYCVFTSDRLTKPDRVSSMTSPSTLAPNKERIKETDTKDDASRCPDCMGTGFYYPAGTAKGVAKCKHAKMK